MFRVTLSYPGGQQKPRFPLAVTIFNPLRQRPQAVNGTRGETAANVRRTRRLAATHGGRRHPRPLELSVCGGAGGLMAETQRCALGEEGWASGCAAPIDSVSRACGSGAHRSKKLVAPENPFGFWRGLREAGSVRGKEMAGTTGLEPATSDVTGRRSNQLNYVPAQVGQFHYSMT